MAEFQHKKRKLIQEVKRSGGTFGAEELAILQSVDDVDDSEAQVEAFLGKSLSSGGAVGALAGHATSTNATFDGVVETGLEMKAHVVVPSQDDIGALLIEQKKLALLGKYT